MTTDLQERTIPSRYITEAGILRDRTRRACSNCASQKLKCSGEEGGCRRCSQNELSCSYPVSKRDRKRAANLGQESSPLQRRLRQSITTEYGPGPRNDSSGPLTPGNLVEPIMGQHLQSNTYEKYFVKIMAICLIKSFLGCLETYITIRTQFERA